MLLIPHTNHNLKIGLPNSPWRGKRVTAMDILAVVTHDTLLYVHGLVAAAQVTFSCSRL